MSTSVPDSVNPPQKYCNQCKQFLPTTNFTIDRSKKDGLRTICKICTKTPKPELPHAPEGYKRCRDCEQIKLATTDFFNATATYASPDGLNTQCIECRKAYRREHNKDVPKVINPKEPLKKCRSCKEKFPADLEHFFFNKNTRDRLTSYCQVCSNKKGKEYRARDGGKEARRAYRKSRKEIDQEYRRAYRILHKDHDRVYRTIYNNNHRFERRKYERRYRQTERGKAISSAILHRRRARKQNSGGSYSAKDIQQLHKAQHGRCYYCSAKFSKGKNAYHVDHIVPIARGGTNNKDNIVLACPSCNLSKGDKLLHEWIQGGRLL